MKGLATGLQMTHADHGIAQGRDIKWRYRQADQTVVVQAQRGGAILLIDEPGISGEAKIEQGGSNKAKDMRVLGRSMPRQS
jgi:hypothetical protein